MLAPRPLVPQLFWDLAMTYACTTHSFNPHSRTGDSPYHYITNRHVDINELHPFWTPVYVFIPLADRDGKVGFPRCWLGRFVGYHSTSIMTRTYRALTISSSFACPDKRISVRFWRSERCSSGKNATIGIHGFSSYLPIAV